MTNLSKEALINADAKEKPTVRISQWYLSRYSDGYALKGNVQDHPRFRPNYFVETSKLLSIDFEKNLAETLNTIYVLE